MRQVIQVSEHLGHDLDVLILFLDNIIFIDVICCFILLGVSIHHLLSFGYAFQALIDLFQQKQWLSLPNDLDVVIANVLLWEEWLLMGAVEFSDCVYAF